MRSWWTSIVFLGLLGCLSPTLPLPPPSPPSEAAGPAGSNTVILHGGVNSAQAKVIVLIRNDDAQFAPPVAPTNEQVTAVLTNADGSWDATVHAVKNDTLKIWVDDGNEQSAFIDFTVMVN